MAIQKVLLFLFLHIHLHGLNILGKRLPRVRHIKCGDNGYYTENSAYRKNLNSLLLSLSSKLDNYGFYYASIGQNADEVSGIVLCRGDVELEECRNCVNNAGNFLVQLCPNQKEAFAGSDECLLQYSNNQSSIETTFSALYFFSDKFTNASKPKEYIQKLRILLENLRDRAAEGGPFRKYASGNVTGPDDQPIYALVQCNPDLSPKNCLKCLNATCEKMPDCPCYYKRGGRIIGPSCNFRYESYPFLHMAGPFQWEGEGDW